MFFSLSFSLVSALRSAHYCEANSININHWTNRDSDNTLTLLYANLCMFVITSGYTIFLAIIVDDIESSYPMTTIVYSYFRYRYIVKIVSIADVIVCTNLKQLSTFICESKSSYITIVI